MNASVFVAGTGVISAIGANTLACVTALEHGQAGMGEMNFLNSIHKGRLPVAEVTLQTRNLAKKAGLPANTTRTALLSCIAASEALEQAAIKDFPSLRTGFISANT